MERTASVADIVYQRDPFKDPNDYPRLYKSKHRNTASRLMWGAWRRSLLPFGVVLLITAAQLAIFEYVLTHDENGFPDLFPIDSYFLGVLLTVIALVGPLFIATELSLNISSLESFNSLAGSCPTLMRKIGSIFDLRAARASISDMFYYSTEQEPKFRSMFLFEVIKELELLVRVYPWCTGLNLLANGNSQEPDDGVSYSNNLTRSAVATLPLPAHLKNELNSYRNGSPMMEDDTPVSDQLLFMIRRRLYRVLYSRENKDNSIVDSVFVSETDAHISSISTESAKLASNRQANGSPIVLGFLAVCVYLFCLALPWVLYGSYRWWCLLLMVPTAWPALGIYYTAKIVSDQFTLFNTSKYQMYDLLQVAIGAAKECDAIADHVYMEAGLGRKTVRLFDTGNV